MGDFATARKTALARAIVRAERGLKDLPKTDHKAVLALVALPEATLNCRAKAAKVPVAPPRPAAAVEIETPVIEAEAPVADTGYVVVGEEVTHGPAHWVRHTARRWSAEAARWAEQARWGADKAAKKAHHEAARAQRRAMRDFFAIHRIFKGKPKTDRIIRTIIKGGRVHVLHATKGWRDYRVSA